MLTMRKVNQLLRFNKLTQLNRLSIHADKSKNCHNGDEISIQVDDKIDGLRMDVNRIRKDVNCMDYFKFQVDNRINGLQIDVNRISKDVNYINSKLNFICWLFGALIAVLIFLMTVNCYFK